MKKEAVVNFISPVFNTNGSLTIIRLVLFNIKISTLLKPPLFFNKL
jgi:hypothetical protein